MGDMNLSIIKHLCSKEFYEAYRDNIKLEYLTKELYPVITTLDGYFKSTDDPVDLSVDDLSNLFFATPRQKGEYYTEVFQALKENDSSVDSTLKLIEGLQTAHKLRELSVLAYDAADGRKGVSDVLKLMEGLSTNSEDANDEDSGEITFTSDDLGELIASSHTVAGLRFRLNSLNKALGSLRKGDFGFIFARPETGKTTFLASEVTYMAQHAEGPILWLNNEEQSNKVMLRCYQSVLNLTLTELMRDVKGNGERFQEIIKGRLKIVDIVSASKVQIERLIDKHKPSLIVFDQIDKVKGFDNDREDLRLGSIYIWARELAKKYCPIIGVCQADGSGEGQRWLTMANVANAKTSKQAEADWILGIGKVNDIGYENLRYLHLSKNKLIGDEDSDSNMRHARWEALLDPERGRYVDL